MLRQLEDRQAKKFKLFKGRLSLPAFLIIPFAVLMAIIIAMITLLSFYKSSEAIDVIKTQIRERTFVEIKKRLIAYMDSAHELNKATHTYISKQRLSINDPLALQDFFWNQLSVYEHINYVYFGYKDGAIMLVARRSDGSFVARETIDITKKQTTAGPSIVYALNEQGRRNSILRKTAPFDSRTRPWFKDAVKKNGPIWTKIYPFFLERSLGITAALPLYDRNNELLGVIATDILLSTLHKILNDLKYGFSGEIFITESDGSLVASTVDKRPFFQIDTKLYRIRGTESQSAVVRSAYQNFQQQPDQKKFTIEVDGKSHLVEMFSFKRDTGIDWNIGITVSEDEILGPVQNTLQLIIYFGIGVLMCGILLCYVLGQRLSAPLRNLKAVATSLAHNNVEARAQKSNIIEINTLASTFNFMADQMQRSVFMLKAKNRELKDQIEQKKKAERRIRYLKEEIDIKQRTKLAGELHDGIGQSLQAINLGLRMINHSDEKEQNARDDGQQITMVPDLIREVDTALSQLRTIIEQQRPMFIDQVDILKAIESYGLKFGRRSGFRFRLETAIRKLELSTFIKEPVFLIFQEALNNVAKYAKAQNVNVSISVTQDHVLKMKISDDGIGFDPANLSADRPGGLGLSLMSERAVSVDGKLSIQSTPDVGTMIFLEVPLEISINA